MQQYLLTPQGGQLVETPVPSKLPQWLRFDVSEINNVDEFIATVQRLTGINIQILHVKDALNPLHPSHYDSGLEYGRFVFRSLLATSIHPIALNASVESATQDMPNRLRKKARYRLPSIATQPITFFINPQVLISVQHSEHFDLAACFTRLNAGMQAELDTAAVHSTTSIHPYQLFLRFINVQVDAYLALRQPLTDQLDRWQRELLDPRRAFNDWASLLDARLELRKLEALSEEQMDAVAELREEWLDDRQLLINTQAYDVLRVRLADIVEHIGRVLNHAKRLESSVESAIQLHFAAVAHQTNHTVRNLTILTGVFAPLSLMTGFYGMNIPLPWQNHPQAVWWIMIGMLLSASLVLGSIVASRLFHRFVSTKFY